MMPVASNQEGRRSACDWVISNNKYHRLILIDNGSHHQSLDRHLRPSIGGQYVEVPALT